MYFICSMKCQAHLFGVQENVLFLLKISEFGITTNPYTSDTKYWQNNVK